MDSFVQQITGLKISVKGVPIQLKKVKTNSLVVCYFSYTLFKYNNIFKPFEFLPKHPSISHVCIFKTYLQTGHFQLPLSQLSLK